ncbi:MAG: hypothetical protein RSA70_06590, partial [Clostridia bacterium]
CYLTSTKQIREALLPFLARIPQSPFFVHSLFCPSKAFKVTPLRFLMPLFYCKTVNNLSGHCVNNHTILNRPPFLMHPPKTGDSQMT